MEVKTETKPKSEPKPKKRKSTSCLGCKNTKPLGPNAFACTSKEPDMLNFTCYE